MTLSSPPFNMYYPFFGVLESKVVNVTTNQNKEVLMQPLQYIGLALGGLSVFLYGLLAFSDYLKELAVFA